MMNPTLIFSNLKVSESVTDSRRPTPETIFPEAPGMVRRGTQHRDRQYEETADSGAGVLAPTDARLRSVEVARNRRRD